MEDLNNNESENFTQRLKDFVKKAAENTYAGNGAYEKVSERDGFYELTYAEGDLSYRDSYTGHYRSWGTELVRQNNKPIWNSLYGGGMVEGYEDIADDTFEFLKKALSSKEEGKESFRGPEHLEDGKWRYEYTQIGNFNNFSGNEKIFYEDKLVFFHNAIGGIIIDKE